MYGRRLEADMEASLRDPVDYINFYQRRINDLKQRFNAGADIGWGTSIAALCYTRGGPPVAADDVARTASSPEFVRLGQSVCLALSSIPQLHFSYPNGICMSIASVFEPD